MAAIANPRSFWEEARYQMVCALCGKPGDFHAHHVVAKNYLRRSYGLTGDALYDTRNALRMHRLCHFQFEHAMLELPMTKLLDPNIEYAFEILGAHAFDYLQRQYTGDDPRVTRALELVG